MIRKCTCVVHLYSSVFYKYCHTLCPYFLNNCYNMYCTNYILPHMLGSHIWYRSEKFELSKQRKCTHESKLLKNILRTFNKINPFSSSLIMDHQRISTCVCGIVIFTSFVNYGRYIEWMWETINKINHFSSSLIKDYQQTTMRL
jgi:hypothetical protein